ncbi:MAG: M48 family metalloprotease [Thiocapsa sp.]|nr:MAG: M48 family metalloprotease [Thiocapsa sp.]
MLLPYSRTHESEADRIGRNLMAQAGFDPRASVALWRNMAAAGGVIRWPSSPPIPPTTRGHGAGRRDGSSASTPRVCDYPSTPTAAPLTPSARALSSRSTMISTASMNTAPRSVTLPIRQAMSHPDGLIRPSPRSNPLRKSSPENARNGVPRLTDREPPVTGCPRPEDHRAADPPQSHRGVRHRPDDGRRLQPWQREQRKYEPAPASHPVAS